VLFSKYILHPPPRSSSKPRFSNELHSVAKPLIGVEKKKSRLDGNAARPAGYLLDRSQEDPYPDLHSTERSQTLIYPGNPYIHASLLHPLASSSSLSLVSQTLTPSHANFLDGNQQFICGSLIPIVLRRTERSSTPLSTRLTLTTSFYDQRITSATQPWLD
jgi:hypothetical protein